MDASEVIAGIEEKFSGVLEALTLDECQQNKTLRIRTKQVITLLRKAAGLKKIPRLRPESSNPRN
jgi:hypothetical protein